MKTVSSIEALESRIAPTVYPIGAGTMPVGNTTLTQVDIVLITLNDAVTGNGKFAVTGTFDPGGANLVLNLDNPETIDDLREFVIVDNDGTDATGGGIFANLPEGSVLQTGDVFFKITYEGGDGNDVVLKALAPVPKISTDGKTATFTDEDGDRVTLKTTKGAWAPEMFKLIPTGDLRGGAHLAIVDIGDGMAGAKITITAKPDLFGGNGFVNITEFSGASSEIQSLSIDGDVGRIDLGSVSTKTLKSLTVHSLGQLGAAIRPVGVDVASISTSRPIATLTVQGDIRDGSIEAASIQKLNVGGSVLGGSTISAGTLGAVTIAHDIVGTADPFGKVTISAYGAATSPKKGMDTAIGSIKVGGRVEWAIIAAGFGTAGENADASIGKITVGGDWIASSAAAGTYVGADGLVATGDDERLSGMGVRDQENLVSTIGSIVIKGQVLGTTGDTADNFGFVAEFIKKAKFGPVKLPLVGTAHTPDDRFFLAATGPGGDGSFSDVALVETLI